MADIQPQLTLQEIFSLPTENPEIAAAIDQCLAEIREIVRAEPPNAEPTETPAADE